MASSVNFHRVARLAALVGCFILAAPASSEPRPLSGAERRAVEMATSLFAEGPRALWPQLSGSSSWRALGDDAAVAEIAVRVGPTRGATWTLRTPEPQHGERVAIFEVEYPSGLDDTLVFELSGRGGRWTLDHIRCLVDPIDGPPPRLASLRAAREALAGARSDDPETLLRRASGAAAVAAVRHAWGAQYRLQRGELAAVEKLLAAQPAIASPLVMLLRARLAQARGETDAAQAFDQARANGFAHDGLAIEATAAVDTFDISEWTLRYGFLAERGSRAAEVYYLLARAAVYEGESPDRYFATAWALEPLPRQDLFADPLLSHAAASRASLLLIQPGSAAEPLPRPPVGARPLALPASARVHRLGDSLEIVVGSGSIRVPGAGSVAPPSAELEDATTRARRREAADLALVPKLEQTAGTADALALPTVRRQVERASEALVRDRRFAEVVRLTRGVAERPEIAGPVLGPLRGRALVEVGRDAEARDLMIALAKNTTSARPDPVPLLQLAELSAEHGRYDLAVRLLRRVQSRSPLPGIDARVRQYELDLELEKSYERFSTRHFDLRYPRTTERRYAVLVAALLEAERERLTRWIPLADGGDRIEVHLFPLDAFMAAYSQGVEVLGLYDGRLRLPFADFGGLHPLIGSVITHELAHAMIAEATDDRAPGWFHEGLAQHIEPEQAVSNPIPDLEEHGSLLAFPLLEAVLDGFAEERFVGLAYDEALWVAHYIESTHGETGFHRLLGAFREGLDTDGALQRVFRQSPAAFDAAFRRWAVRDAPIAWPAEEPDYSDRVMAKVAEAIPNLEEEIVGDEDHHPKLSYRTPTPENEEAEHWSLWYAYYTRTMRPMKLALRPVVDMVRHEKGSGRIEDHCLHLAETLMGMTDDEALFTAPDPAINESVHAALVHFARAAGACRQRRFGEVDRELEAALGSLGTAAKHMAPRGLKP